MDALAEVCEQIASHSSRLRKVALLSAYLRPLSDLDLRRAVRFLCCGPIQNGNRKASVGGATLREAAAAVTGWDAFVLGHCYAEAGDTGETISLLLNGRTA